MAESTRGSPKRRVPHPVPEVPAEWLRSVPWDLEPLGVIEKQQSPERWPRDPFPILPMRAWRRWVVGDVYPLVVDLARVTKRPPDLVHAMILAGPEGFIGWWNEEQMTRRMGIVGPHKTPELVRRWNAGVSPIRWEHLDSFAVELGSLGFIHELRNVGRILEDWLDNAKTSRHKRAMAKQLQGFVHNNWIAKYLRRRELVVRLVHVEGLAFPVYQLDDLLARACWEVLGEMLVERARAKCPGCGRVFEVKRAGQAYCDDDCYRRVYFADLARQPTRREYQRLYKKRDRLKKAGGSKAEINRLSKELEQITRERAERRS